MSARRFWPAEDDALLTARYPDTRTAEVAAKLGRSIPSTYERARKLGLAKTAAYLASPAACRLLRGDAIGAGTRFAKGHVPANKGLRRPGYAPGRMGETQFRPGVRRGRAVRIYRPIGAERVSADGYLERKVNDDLPRWRRWRAVHLLVWEDVHGPVPEGHAVVFLNGDRTDIRLENLALVPRAELMRRNSVHNLPAPLPQVVQLIGALTRKINRRARHDEKQDRGSEESPVRGTGGIGGQGGTDGDRAREGDRGRRTRDRGLCEGRDPLSHRDRSEPRDGVHRATRGGRTRITASARRGERSQEQVARLARNAGGRT